MVLTSPITSCRPHRWMQADGVAKFKQLPAACGPGPEGPLSGGSDNRAGARIPAISIGICKVLLSHETSGMQGLKHPALKALARPADFHKVPLRYHRPFQDNMPLQQGTRFRSQRTSSPRFQRFQGAGTLRGGPHNVPRWWPSGLHVNSGGKLPQPHHALPVINIYTQSCSTGSFPT